MTRSPRLGAVLLSIGCLYMMSALAFQSAVSPVPSGIGNGTILSVSGVEDATRDVQDGEQSQSPPKPQSSGSHSLVAIKIGVVVCAALLIILVLAYISVIRPRRRKGQLLDKNHVILTPRTQTSSTISDPQQGKIPPQYSLPLSLILSKKQASTDKSLVCDLRGPTTPAFNALTDRQMNLHSN